MKILRKIISKLCIFQIAGIALCMVILITGSPCSVYCFDLKSQAEDFLKQERFPELLDFLDILRQEKREDMDELQIEYYSVLTKSKYLDYLEQKEDWEACRRKSILLFHSPVGP